MIISLRTALAAVALVTVAACIDVSRPTNRITTHTLLATTEIVAGDSISCIVFAQIPLPDSIRPWSGTTTVQVRRYRNTTTGPVQVDTTPMGATIDIARGVGDSLHVSIQGPFSLVLSGRLVDAPYAATGQFRCDDRIPLSGAAPGRANGVWTLSTDRLVD